jgi:hypothetical protein
MLSYLRRRLILVAVTASRWQRAGREERSGR